jgi:hypothetical protein
VKSLQKEQNSTNLLLWPPICRNKSAITPKWFNSMDTNSTLFKYFITNLTFILSQILHLKSSLQEQFWYDFSIHIFFQIYLKKVLIMNNFYMLSQFIFSLQYFTTNLTFEKFQIFCHWSYIWKVLIMNNFIMLCQFMFYFKYFIANLTFENFQIFCHKYYIWKVLIMNNSIMLSQFIFYFKYFITNLIFEKFSSWTIVICLLNSYFLWNILSQISHLKSSHHEQF